MNFARDVVDAARPERMALVELARDGSRREWCFGDVSQRSAGLAGALRQHGVRRGDVVMTLIGNRPEWVLTMVACFRIGAVVLPCHEQLRAHDLRLRITAAQPKLIVADERDTKQLSGAGVQCPVLSIPDASLLSHEPVPPVELDASDPCLIAFTSGTTGDPSGVVHGQRYLPGQRLQAEYWLDAREGDLVWCTAATGWSKSARNAFVAPWLRGAAAVLHDARFDPAQRLALLASERVNVLCMAPTEYRMIAKRVALAPLPGLRAMVAAGEPLPPEVLRAFREGTGLEIRDGYGQTETGQLTGMGIGERARPGSMGRALPGVELRVEPDDSQDERSSKDRSHAPDDSQAEAEGELVLVDPRSDPTFFIGRLDGEPAPAGVPWRTGDRVHRDADGYLYFEARADDVIISAGYRIGPFEVESALLAHEAVAEAAVVGAADEERGAVVRAVVVAREGFAPGADLAAELQEHVKRVTAPYKYPRIVEFAAALPKTATGKVRRAALRGTR
ncbi:MAG: acyl-CoA synthetase [Solirubrobacteraceae bacterium]